MSNISVYQTTLKMCEGAYRYTMYFDFQVCQEAGIDCRVVWDRYENCWDSQVGQHATGGQGKNHAFGSKSVPSNYLTAHVEIIGST